MKYVKVQVTEEEFDEVMQYGIFDIAYEARSLIMNKIRQKENNHGTNQKAKK